MTTALNVFAQKKIVSNPDYPVRDNAAIDINQVAASRPPVPFGYKPATTGGLTFGYYGGEMWVDGVLTNIAAGTLALDASVTNYIEATRAGAISKNSTGFTAGQTPLFEATTDSGSITAINDRRISNAPLTGRLVLSVAGGAGDTTLTAAQARNNIMEFTGALTGARNIIVPAVAQAWVIYNNTSGAFALTVKTAAGTGVAITQGQRAPVYCDGTNVVAAVSDLVAIGAAALAGATFTGPINEKGFTVAAHATTCDIWSGGNIGTLTGGVVTFTDVADAPVADAWRLIHSNAAHILTNGANIAVQGGANFTLAAGDLMLWHALTTTTFKVFIFKADGTAVAVPTTQRKLAQVVTYTTGAVSTGTTILPADDSIPQNTEGDQCMTLAITPVNASSTLELDVEAIAGASISAEISMALFQDTTANALTASSIPPSGGYPTTNILKHIMAAGTTSATTFKVRVGMDRAGTTTFNGAGGVRIFGGVAASRITIKEWLP